MCGTTHTTLWRGERNGLYVDITRMTEDKESVMSEVFAKISQSLETNTFLQSLEIDENMGFTSPTDSID